MLLWSGLAVLLVAVVGLSIFLFRRRSTDADFAASSQTGASSTTAPNSQSSSVRFRTDAIAELDTEVYKLAFGVTRVDYRILGDHVRILRATQEAVAGAMNEPKYFPRKPALLPKLLRAINTLEGGRNEIVRLILQDAGLAGNVLKRANSVYYRHHKDEVVESVDRAVTILGTEGLRAPVANAVMQPVFQLPAGFFEQFAPITWEQARRTAAAAEEFARTRKSADEFVAHLAGMLSSLSRIVLFRLTMDKYRERGNVMPRAEVFIRVMAEKGAEVTRSIASAWEMSPAFVEAFEAQIQATPPQNMSPLAGTVYYANLFGTLATLHHHDKYTHDAARDLLIAQGLPAETFEMVWRAATDSEIS